MKRLAIVFVLILILQAFACTKEEVYSQESSINVAETTATKELEATSPDVGEAVIENKVAEIESIVAKLCDNKEHRFYAENSLGKGLQNEIISMADIVANRVILKELNKYIDDIYDYDKSDFERYLFRNKVWNEVTGVETRVKTIIGAVDLGYIRIFNECGEEFIVLKSMNGAIYKSDSNTRYFLWYENDGRPASSDDFCNFWYDGMSAGTEKLANMVIYVNADKTREELAYEIMEAYREYSAGLLSDNAYYFDELKIISLESYDESDSGLSSFIGTVTEDILKFYVCYAVNSDNRDGMLVGSWSMGEGEYQGWMVNSCWVEAKKHDGKWHCVFMGNG